MSENKQEQVPDDEMAALLPDDHASENPYPEDFDGIQDGEAFDAEEVASDE